MKEVISFSLEKSLIERIKDQNENYDFGSASQFVESIFKSAILHIEIYGLDSFRESLKNHKDFIRLRTDSSKF